MTIEFKRSAASALLAAAMAGGSFALAGPAQASCNPNTGCLPRPVDVMEVGGEYGFRYYVKPHSLDIVQNSSSHIYITGLRWSKWTGGYGVHGLIRGSATGTGTAHATDTGRHKVTVYLWAVTNYGVNAFTYYDQLSIHGDSHVAKRWTWSNRHSKWYRS